MLIMISTYLESEEFGCEFFSNGANIESLRESAEEQTAMDGITRREIGRAHV